MSPVRFGKGLADSVLSASDEELIEEVRDEGLDPDAVAEETRGLLLQTVQDFKQRALVAAREQHRQKAACLAVQRYRLPVSPEERHQLLDGVILVPHVVADTTGRPVLRCTRRT